jgi:hypothetical protein
VIPKATLVVTIDHTTLTGALSGALSSPPTALPGMTGTGSGAGAGAGATVGGVDAGTLLAPETVRRIACDAAILPAVLGTEREVLDWGRTKRLFTPGQTRRLWVRDGGCTWPGCTIPAAWTDAHHLIHWVHGGATDLDNAALLCGRHHTLVHTRRHAGTLTHGRVQWDPTPGSYDRLLELRAHHNNPDGTGGSKGRGGPDPP